jgi:hypothetical protein
MNYDMKTNPEEKILDIVRKTMDNDELKYDKGLNNLDFYSLLCMSASKDSLFSLCGANVCMFKYSYNNNESVLILFSIPIITDSIDGKSKHITERIIDTVQLLENTFVTLDYLNVKEVKEEKFVYLVAIKSFTKNNDN